MRVWVTGLGLVCALGQGAKATFSALIEGRRAQREVTLFDTSSLKARLAAYLPDFELSDVVPKGEASSSKWSRSDALALEAAREALASAKLPTHSDCALIVGGTTGGMTLPMEDDLVRMLRDPEYLPPLARVIAHPLSATADRLHETLGPFRRTLTLTSACSSGANAIALADAWIRTGKATRVLAGGTDGLCRITFLGFNLLLAMDPEPCKPFDAKRAGMNIGEGAGFLVLEREDLARARGAIPIAELNGYAIGSEAHHITQPDPSGAPAARLITEALQKSRIEPHQIDYINAHGTATAHNDAAECAAFKKAFGPALEGLRVSSSKGQIGHTLGAAGAIEAAISAMAIQQKIAPPTMGLSEPDPKCQVPHIRERGLALPLRAALSTSFGFGGADTVLVLSEPSYFEAPPPLSGPRACLITKASSFGPLGLQTAPEPHGYGEAGPAPKAGRVAFERETLFEPMKARRFDEAAARMTAVCQALLRSEAKIPREDLGLVAGIAVRADEAATFLKPMFEKGYRTGNPAEFPNTMLSTSAGHSSIYLGLKGPVFTLSELQTSTLSALIAAAELILSGQADTMLAAGVNTMDSIVDRAFAEPVFERKGSDGPRSEGAAAFLLEAEAGQGIGARLAAYAAGPDARALHLPIPSKGSRSHIVRTRPDAAVDEAIEHIGWKGVAQTSICERAGQHEALDALALSTAFTYLLKGTWDEILVIARASNRMAAVVLERIDS